MVERIANKESNVNDNKNNRTMKYLRQGGKNVHFNVKCLVRAICSTAREWKSLSRWSNNRLKRTIENNAARKKWLINYLLIKARDTMIANPFFPECHI